MLVYAVLIGIVLARVVHRYICGMHVFAFLEENIEDCIYFHTSETIPIDYLIRPGFPEVPSNSLFYRIAIDVNDVTERVVYMTKSGNKVDLFINGMYKTSTSVWLAVLKALASSPAANMYWGLLFDNEVLTDAAKVSVSIVVGVLRPDIAAMSGLHKLSYIAA